LAIVCKEWNSSGICEELGRKEKAAGFFFVKKIFLKIKILRRILNLIAR